MLLRPGPYICSEWDFGGFPAWLLADQEMHVRTTDPKFLQAAGRYMKRVGEAAANLEIARGGPILAVQVENEYGSFGKDKVYMEAIRQMIVDAGFHGSLYTADGSGAGNLAGGTLDGVLSVINFGDNANVEREFANFAKFRTGVPRMNGEYWCGWFDHWGETHHTTNAQRSAAGVEWMLSRGISFNLYMVHGGSSWGYMSGANGGRQYEPDTSAYDYDSPLDEAGRPTEKFRAMREVIGRHLPAGETLPELPANSPATAAIRSFRAKGSGAVNCPSAGAAQVREAGAHGIGRPILRLHPLSYAAGPRCEGHAGNRGGSRFRGDFFQRRHAGHTGPAAQPDEVAKSTFPPVLCSISWWRIWAASTSARNWWRTEKGSWAR